MRYWLMKSEPDTYSIDDLAREHVGRWDGTRNYQVRNFLRDAVRVGDRAFFYHSNAGAQTGVVGEMEVVRGAYPDPTQFDPADPHYDPKSDPADPRWLCVDVRFVERFPRVVTLAVLKLDPVLADMPVVKRGNRLSVMPVSQTHYNHVRRLARRAGVKR